MEIKVTKLTNETTKVFQEIKDKIKEVDHDLHKMLVRKCVYRNGICGESCGFNQTDKFREELKDYLSNYTKKQKTCSE